MDLNELLDAHQRAVMQIGNAAGPDSGGDSAGDGEHATRIALYAASIRNLRDGPAPADQHPDCRNADTIIYAGRSDTGEPRSATPALAAWEAEGGARVPPHDPLPAGITMTMRPEYRVGAHTYSDLALALAEHARQQRPDGPVDTGP